LQQSSLFGCCFRLRKKGKNKSEEPRRSVVTLDEDQEGDLEEGKGDMTEE